MNSRPVTIALAQHDSIHGDFEANLKKMQSWIVDAHKKGADIICFPELGTTGYRQDMLGDKLYELAEDPQDGPTFHGLSSYAKSCNMYVVAPIVIKDPEGQIHHEGLAKGKPIVYNAMVLIGRDGEYIGVYAKNHAFDTEERYFALGNKMPVFDLDFGKVGIMICFDMGVVETARVLSLKGAELLLAPSAWRVEDELMWDLNTACRALENRVYLAAVNRVGREGDELLMFGKSKVCDFDGRIVAEAHRFDEELLICTVNLAKVRPAQKEVPYLYRRKPQNYEIFTKEDVL